MISWHYYSDALPKIIIPQKITKRKILKTLKDPVLSIQVVTLQDIRLPEFDKNMIITKQKAIVFDNPKITYHVILGTVFFVFKNQIKLQKIKWISQTVSFS